MQSNQEKWQVQWVPVSKIKLDPKNRNKHPADQIERLAKGMRHYGWIGNPIVVDVDVDECRAGEGRFLAAKQAGLTEVPVHYKKFSTSDDSRGFATFDNGISKWAELDFAGINEDVADLGPDFDIDLLGLKDFTLDPGEIAIKEKELDENINTEKECPSCGYKW